MGKNAMDFVGKNAIDFVGKNPSLGNAYTAKNMSAIVSYRCLLEMSSSWNFPARASPSYEDSEPSRAELVHSNFRAETELNFF
jgi:hypothetical protein